MYYLLYNKQLNKYLIYDELSDTLFKNGWRMIREVRNSDVNTDDFYVNKEYLKDYEKYEIKYKNRISNSMAFKAYCIKNLSFTAPHGDCKV